LWDDAPLHQLESESDKPKARLSWLGRLILLTLEQNSPALMKLIEIRDFLRQKFLEQNPPLPWSENFDDEIADNLSQLEQIFDAVKQEDNHYTFSIPLAQAWLHNKIRQYDDPWQFALERFQKEYKKSRRTNKEQK
jgi:hypothetical protein